MATPGEIASRRAPHAPPGLREPKLAIALSGGGYRAMLFHLGAVRRLNEFGLLSVMDRISTVSGGSIAAAVLGRRWHQLDFDDNGVARGLELVEGDIFAIADRTIDVRAGLVGLLPWTTGAAEASRALREWLGDTLLSDLPGDRPRFTFNATNLRTGNLFRWAPGYAADYGLGMIEHPRIALADVVAASAAFPPWLSPLRLRVPGVLVDADTKVPISNPPRRLWLTDGGVYDNLGIEPLKSFHTVLAGDGGAPFANTVRLRADPFSQAMRTAFILNDHQGRQRRRTLVEEFIGGRRLGALWRIDTPIEAYPAEDRLPCPRTAVQRLARIKTRLRSLPDTCKRQLVNWGYASADAAVRAYVDGSLPPPAGFPYIGGVG